MFIEDFKSSNVKNTLHREWDSGVFGGIVG